jgi:hypothetical protein
MYNHVSPQGTEINVEGQPSAAWSTSHGFLQSQNVDFPMDIELPTHSTNGQTTNVQGSPMAQEFPARVVEPEPMQDHVNGQAIIPPPGNKLGKLGSLSFGKKHGKWGLGMFGGDKSHHHGLPPLEEVPVPANPMPSLKRMQSSSTDSKSLRDLSPVRESPLRTDGDVKKINKKEAERVQREAEKQRRKLAEKMHREQARAVMQKRNQMMQKTIGNDIEWEGGNEQRLDFSETLSKGKQASSGPIRQNQINNGNSTTISAAAGRFALQGDSPVGDRDWRGANERVPKARRREFDDDHSMSSSDVHSIGRMSSISFASVDSDPGPARIRNRPSLFGISRMTSMSSLHTSFDFDDFSPSARSSNSFSLEGQLAHDFHMQASVNAPHLVGSVSPPPMQTLSLSPTLSPSLSPSPPWIQVQHVKEPLSTQSPTYVTVPLVHPNGSYGQSEVNRQLHGRSPNSYGHPPSPGNTPTSAKSAINPIFKVVSYKWDSTHGLVPDDFGDFVQPPLPPDTGDSLGSHNTLPPFSQLEAIAGGERPLLSPMSFVSTPSEDA